MDDEALDFFRFRIYLDAKEVYDAEQGQGASNANAVAEISLASYISTLDFSSAFLQIYLENPSRKWTAFQFRKKLYQLTRVPNGFRNSLGYFHRYWGLTPVNTLLVVLLTAHDKLKEK
jgi:hypothetical protein